MQYGLFIISIFIVSCMYAQKTNSFAQQFDDSGRTLLIVINGFSNNKSIDYKKTFDVSGMSAEKKKALKTRVYDSLGLIYQTGPAAALAPATLSLAALAEPATTPGITAESENLEMFAIGGSHPVTKEIRYHSTTRCLNLRYRFVKNAEETTIEKTMEAKKTSKETRRLLIKKFEQENNLLPPGIS